MAKPARTISQRALQLVPEEVGELLARAGFRRARLVFTRRHGTLQHTLRFDAGTLVSGGASLPVGRIRATVYIAQSGMLEVAHLVPGARGSWDVPMRDGPKRKLFGADLRRVCKKLVDVLEPVRDKRALGAFVRQAAFNRWRTQQTWLKATLRSTPSKDVARIAELKAALARVADRLAELDD